jgi:hypothetical protein
MYFTLLNEVKGIIYVYDYDTKKLLLLFSYCKNPDNGRFVELDKGFRITLPPDALENSRLCIIIPRSGCGGCIDNAVQYLKTKMDSLKDVNIVITGISDKKLLKLELGSDFLSRKNVYLDTNRAFQGVKIISSYPQIVSMKDGRATEIHELDVYSSDMNKLLSGSDK